jgi:hypothetical protein
MLSYFLRVFSSECRISTVPCKKPRPLTLHSCTLSPTASTATDRTSLQRQKQKAKHGANNVPQSRAQVIGYTSSNIRHLHVTHSTDRRSILGQSRDCSFSTTSVHTTYRHHHVFYPVGTGRTLSRVKRPERDADHPPPSSVEVNACSCICTSR